MKILQHKASLALEQGKYPQATQLYEQLIDAEPEVKSHYWHLGLVQLLQGQTIEAQTTWLMAMLNGEAEQLERWNQSLVEILEREAHRQEARGVNAVSWDIRQQIREICPTDLNNILHLIRLTLQMGAYSGEELSDWGILQQLQSQSSGAVDFDLLVSLIKQVFDYAPFNPSSLELAATSLQYADSEPKILYILNVLLEIATDLGYFKRQPGIAATLCELVLKKFPQQLEYIYCIASFYQDSEQYEKGIETAKLYFSLVEGNLEQIIANKKILRALMATGGRWQEALTTFGQHETMLRSIVAHRPEQLTSIQISRLFNVYFFAPYFRDRPREDRKLQNQVACICQVSRQALKSNLAQRYAWGCQQRRSHQLTEQRLKIGYLSHCLKAHSVGWLARWLFQYANRDRFEIFAYMITSHNTYEPLQDWYAEQVTTTYKSTNAEKLAEQIHQDEIDILIELDSITLDCPCEVVALKPAPVQVTWLGWDASGIPAIDYFIADPYVLPETAQEYYQEKIWRLPNTYIAVDGFEVGVPTLHRDDLEIEQDAVVYLSAQRGYKRHLDTVRLQMQIVKQVPNSYFLVKGSANLKAVQNSFYKIAEEEGVKTNCLRFLPSDPSEAIHRANLTIADIVLDTYPYNGATTTLETLWMGIPLVTRVGEQFAARNSYTMMVNAGITEGIAWTDEEYVEWGVRLGKDATLRQQVVWKLRQSRHSSPLWKGKQFTREMEKAYREMWIKYING